MFYYFIASHFRVKSNFVYVYNYLVMGIDVYFIVTENARILLYMHKNTCQIVPEQLFAWLVLLFDCMIEVTTQSTSSNSECAECKKKNINGDLIL